MWSVVLKLIGFIRLKTADLEDAEISNFISVYNEDSKIYTWTKDADTVIAKWLNCKEALGQCCQVSHLLCRAILLNRPKEDETVRRLTDRYAALEIKADSYLYLFMLQFNILQAKPTVHYLV